MKKIDKGRQVSSTCSLEGEKVRDGAMLKRVALTVALVLGGMRDVNAERFHVDDEAGRSCCHMPNRIGEDAIEQNMPYEGWRLYRTPLVKRPGLAKARRATLPTRRRIVPTGMD